jgi:hypothetical protein
LCAYELLALPGAAAMISGDQKLKIRHRAATELRRFVAIAAYLWVLLSVFEIHRVVVLRQAHASSLSGSGYRFGFALVNALVLGKVILLGQVLHAGERLREARLMHSVMYKAGVFALLLVCFEVVEEVMIGLLHGKSIIASIPQLGGGGVLGVLLLGIMAFVVLIPLFLFTELERVIGKDNLHSIIMHNDSKTNAA